jgi:cell division protein FtsL
MQTRRDNGITFGLLSVALIAMAIVLVLALVKVYLSNRIYYESRQTNRIEREVGALREEHTLLQMQVEKLKYKTQVTDTLFTLDPTDLPESDTKETP